jgi:putative ABC transport system permease protein
MTRVTRVLDAGELPGLGRFDLLAIDPETFTAAAYWRDGFSDLPLEELVSRVATASEAGLPAIAVRGDEIETGTPVELSQRRLELDVVGHATGFPGMTSLRPLIVVTESNLLDILAGSADPTTGASASTEFWVRGDPAEAQAALEGLQYAPYLVLTADQVKDIPSIAVVIQTFLVLNLLGLAAAALVIVGLLMYVQARQRSQVVSYGLSLRMGMTHGGHRRALALELGTMLLASLLIGVGLALLATRLIVPLLDPLSTIPPAPLFEQPDLLIAAAIAGVLAVAWIGALLTNRSAQAVDLGQVMRLAD